MPRISINDGSLYYERHGAGFPVLMISGLGGLASFWHEQVAAFAKRYEVITHDSALVQRRFSRLLLALLDTPEHMSR